MDTQVTQMRRIEFTEDACRIGAETYQKGDVRSFPQSEADQYIKLGWAKDHESGEQGERVPGAQALDIQPVVQEQSAT